MAQKDYGLGAAELEMLKALWKLGPSSVRAVMDYLHQSERQLAYTTVQTTLTRLVRKGVVACDKTGLAFVYRACVTRDQLSRSRLKDLLNQLYDGAAGPLVLQLIRREHLTSAEITELQRLIDELDTSQH